MVDKATKLETLYDRIHEIRTRFEVLKRDAWINYWQALANGGDEPSLAQQRDARLAELDDDFAFVARSNVGGEAMAEADLQRWTALPGKPGPAPWMTGWACHGKKQAPGDPRRAEFAGD